MIIVFDTPDIVTPTLICGIVILAALGLVFLGGLIPALRIIRTDAQEPLRKQLSRSLAAMSVGALGTVFLCVLLAQMSVATAWEISHALDGAICRETPIAAQYKLVVTQFRSGNENAEVVSLTGETQIYAIDRYAVVGKYVTGQTDHNYFWFDLETGAYRYLNSEGRFLESLEPLGVLPPELLSTDTICQTWDCQPCTRQVPTR